MAEPFKGPRNEANVVEPAADDVRVQARLFGGIAAFLALAALVYWLTSYEEAGTVMLVLAAGLGALAGAYLWAQDRRPGPDHPPGAGGQGEHGPGEHYLPHASVWPLGVGAAAYLVVNGLILGIWFLVPGLVLAGVSVTGYCLQSRRRD